MVNSRKSVVRNSGISSHKNKLNLSNTLRKGFLRKGGAVTKKGHIMKGGVVQDGNQLVDVLKRELCDKKQKFILQSDDGTCYVDKNYRFCEGPLLTDSYKFSHYRQYPICYLHPFMPDSDSKVNMLYLLKEKFEADKSKKVIQVGHNEHFLPYIEELKKDAIKGTGKKCLGGYNISYFEPRKFKSLNFPLRNSNYEMVVHPTESIKLDGSVNLLTTEDIKIDKETGQVTIKDVEMDALPQIYKDELENFGHYKLLNDEVAKRGVVNYGLQYYIQKYLAAHPFVPPIDVAGPYDVSKGMNDPVNAETIQNYRKSYLNRITQYVSGSGGHFLTPDVFNEFDWLAIAIGPTAYGPVSDYNEFLALMTPDTNEKLKAGSEYHWEKTEAGYLPILIEGVPEGTCLPSSNMLFKIINTHPRFYWLPNYLETLFVQVWYPMTIASTSRLQKLIIAAGKDLSGNNGTQFNPDYQCGLLDFGMRGASSLESAALGSSAYLTSFEGTDTNVGIPLIQNFYQGKEMPVVAIGDSLPASEHSTITSWCTDRNPEGQLMHNIREQDAFANHFKSYSEGSVAVACVIDGYNVWNAIWNQFWTYKLLTTLDTYQRVAALGTIVLRPDSGEGIESMVQLAELYKERVIHFLKHIKRAAASTASAPAADAAADVGAGKSIKKKSAKRNRFKGGYLDQLNDETAINKYFDGPESADDLGRKAFVNDPNGTLVEGGTYYQKPYNKGTNWHYVPYCYLHPDHLVELVKKLDEPAPAPPHPPERRLLDSLRTTYESIVAYKPDDPTSYIDFERFRILQGDAVELATLPNYISSVMCHGYALTNFVFGSGGGLLQKVNRDTLSCAFKCAGMIIPDEGMRIIQKRPITDGDKKSKGGNICTVAVPPTEGEDRMGENTKFYVPGPKDMGANTEDWQGQTLKLPFANYLTKNEPDPFLPPKPGPHPKLGEHHKDTFHSGGFTPEDSSILNKEDIKISITDEHIVNKAVYINGHSINPPSISEIRDRNAISEPEMKKIKDLGIQLWMDNYRNAMRVVDENDNGKYVHNTLPKMEFRKKEAMLQSYWFGGPAAGILVKKLKSEAARLQLAEP